jgi:hypothetical protein
VKSAALLGGGKVTFERHDAKSHLRVAPGDQHAIDTIVKLELDGSAMDIPAISFTPNIKATASTVFHTNVNDFGPQQAFDGDPSTRWATDGQTTQAWIARDLEKPTKVSRVRIDEAVGQRVRKFELQYRDGDAWKTIFTGEKIGRKFERAFPPVTAREFRLNILDAPGGPTIAEIELLEM